MISKPELVEDINISDAWVQTLHKIINSPGKEITPLVLTLTEFNETIEVRDTLNKHLQGNGFQTVETVSETIFPQPIYELVDYNRMELYDEYVNNLLPRLQKIDKKNSRGTYFQRLIAYNSPQGKINQLEMIIKTIRDNKIKRRSKLQAGIFDPTVDHLNGPFQGFPCLQHVTFYKSENDGLILNSFYANQYLYERAYGNWLGLINLGKFVAKELNIELERFTCFIGVEQLDGLTKDQAEKLLSRIKKHNSSKNS